MYIPPFLLATVSSSRSSNSPKSPDSPLKMACHDHIQPNDEKSEKIESILNGNEMIPLTDRALRQLWEYCREKLPNSISHLFPVGLEGNRPMQLALVSRVIADTMRANMWKNPKLARSEKLNMDDVELFEKIFQRFQQNIPRLFLFKALAMKWNEMLWNEIPPHFMVSVVSLVRQMKWVPPEEISRELYKLVNLIQTSLEHHPLREGFPGLDHTSNVLAISHICETIKEIDQTGDELGGPKVLADAVLDLIIEWNHQAVEVPKWLEKECARIKSLIFLAMKIAKDERTEREEWQKQMSAIQSFDTDLQKGSNKDEILRHLTKWLQQRDFKISGTHEALALDYLLCSITGIKDVTLHQRAVPLPMEDLRTIGLLILRKRIAGTQNIRDAIGDMTPNDSWSLKEKMALALMQTEWIWANDDQLKDYVESHSETLWKEVEFVCRVVAEKEKELDLK